MPYFIRSGQQFFVFFAMPASTLSACSTTEHWAIFCQVIDNYGDVGVCWRLASDLAARGVAVRLYIDDASALQWMAPSGAAGVTVVHYDSPYHEHPSVVIEAFGCEAPDTYLQQLAQQVQRCRLQHSAAPVLINLEYLSAEDYVERCHRLPSLIMSGPAQGLTRWFFYPGFTAATGGLLRELNLSLRQQHFDADAWRLTHGIAPGYTTVSLFCYEPPALAQFMHDLQGLQAQTPCHLLVTPGRASAAVQALGQDWHFPVSFLDARPQTAFDELLWACDLNLVRGEDSLVRAIWAGQAFIWQIYPQHDNAHYAKLDAF